MVLPWKGLTLLSIGVSHGKVFVLLYCTGGKMCVSTFRQVPIVRTSRRTSGPSVLVYVSDYKCTCFRPIACRPTVSQHTVQYRIPCRAVGQLQYSSGLRVSSSRVHESPRPDARRSALNSGHPLTLPHFLLSSHPDPVLPTVALPLIDSGPASILLPRIDKCWSHRTSCRLVVVDGQLGFFSIRGRSNQVMERFVLNQLPSVSSWTHNFNP